MKIQRSKIYIYVITICYYLHSICLFSQYYDVDIVLLARVNIETVKGLLPDGTKPLPDIPTNSEKFKLIDSRKRKKHIFNWNSISTV